MRPTIMEVVSIKWGGRIVFERADALILTGGRYW